MTRRDGADVVFETAEAAGLDVCFANPGTTEMHLVAALDRHPAIRPVLGLFEGVVTGAADGYARMTGRPALTLLHLGPGFANGIANLHNARRAHTPVVNLIGDHATWHLDADAPLTSDIESLARPVGPVVNASEVDRVGIATAEAITLSLSPPTGPVSLVLPQDATWDDADGVDPGSVALAAVRVDADAVEAAIAELRRPGAALIVGGDARRREGVEACRRIAAATGCALWAEPFSARVGRGGGLADVPVIPYFPEAAVDALAGVSVAVLAGTPDPMAFFGYPDQPSRVLPADAERVSLIEPGHPTQPVLDALVAALDAPPVLLRQVARPDRPTGPLSTKTLGAAVAGAQPEGAIVVNEAATSGNPWLGMSATAPAHDVLGLTGGAIGQGLPSAVGAAVACPDRPVLALQADGSGLYTNQALWTMAREGLDVTVVVCANRAYRILQVELGRAGAEPGPASRAFMDLREPTIDWVSLATGFGVPAVAVTDAADLADELDRAFAEDGPHLIEAVL